MLPGVDQPRTVRVTLELGLAAALEHVIGADTLTRPGPAPADE